MLHKSESPDETHKSKGNWGAPAAKAARGDSSCCKHNDASTYGTCDFQDSSSGTDSGSSSSGGNAEPARFDMKACIEAAGSKEERDECAAQNKAFYEARAR